MRIVCISDTHNLLHKIAVPDGDLLVHAGDLTRRGRRAEIYAAYKALSNLPHARIVVTPGNHDFGFEQSPDLVAELHTAFPRIETLIDAATTVDGLRLYASPFQPWFYDWAFNFLPGPPGVKQAEEKWAEIPGDTAILITHGPMYGVLDETRAGEHAGCPALKARIAQLRQLRFHIFGHIHEAHGTQVVGSVLHVNASICDVDYVPNHEPIVLDTRAFPALSSLPASGTPPGRDNKE
ncbi:MAG TPA: metallophosphoesterase family protein [Candidatus Baltobacteraceae bacterium]